MGPNWASSGPAPPRLLCRWKPSEKFSRVVGMGRQFGASKIGSLTSPSYDTSPSVARATSSSGRSRARFTAVIAPRPWSEPGVGTEKGTRNPKNEPARRVASIHKREVTRLLRIYRGSHFHQNRYIFVYTCKKIYRNDMKSKQKLEHIFGVILGSLLKHV